MKFLLSFVILLTACFNLIAGDNTTGASATAVHENDSTATRAPIIVESIVTGDTLRATSTNPNVAHITIYRQKGKNILTITGNEAQSLEKLPEGLYVKDSRKLIIRR